MDAKEKSAHTLVELNEFLRGMRDPDSSKPIIDFLMDFENPEAQKFLTLLKEHQVQYMIVGGMATALHGHPRATVDLDY